MARLFGGMAVRAAVIIGALTAVPPYRPTVQAQSLAKRLDARLDAPPFDRQLWGVALVDDKGKLIYGRNERRLFTPASNTKLVVSAVATALLPPEWTVRTSLYGGGPVVDGMLEGDLVLYGRGDPTMGRRCYATDSTLPEVCDTDPFDRFRALVDTLRSRGIRTVRGDVVGDGSYFEPTTLYPDWSWFDLNWWYAAPVTALAFNDNSIDFHWRPGPAVGAPALISMSPVLGDIAFENRTRTVPQGGVTDLDDRFYRHPGTLAIWAEGTVAENHPGRTVYVAHPDPSRYAAQALRQALLDAGIAILGTARSTADSMLYAHLRSSPPLAEAVSRPLRDWIFPILNTSQNLYAEMLLKQLGRQFGRGGSWEEGIAVERRFLIDSVGIDSTEFVLMDGSGLAAGNLVTPLAFTRLLRFIERHPRYSTFAAALPRSGAVGSLRRRFTGTPLDGRVRAKTGSIGGVNTLTGYIDRPNGKSLVFSVQANHHALDGRTILAGIDSVVVAMGRR